MSLFLANTEVNVFHTRLHRNKISIKSSLIDNGRALLGGAGHVWTTSIHRGLGLLWRSKT